MKIKNTIILFSLCVLLFLPGAVSAQMTDQKIDSVQKEIDTLKEALKQKELRRLEAERDVLKKQLESEDAARPAAAPLRTAAPAAARAAAPSAGALAAIPAQDTTLVTSIPKIAETGKTLSQQLKEANNQTVSHCDLVLHLDQNSYSRFERAICSLAKTIMDTRREQAQDWQSEADSAQNKMAIAAGEADKAQNEIDTAASAAEKKAAEDKRDKFLQLLKEAKKDKDDAIRQKAEALKGGMAPGSANSNLIPLIKGKMEESMGVSNDKMDLVVKSFLLQSEDARMDKQMGADAKTAGTTSLAVKGGVPAFLGWATENGAAEGSITGNTVTFRVNPYGLTEALYRWQTNNGLFRVNDATGVSDYFRKDDYFTKFLRNTAIGFSFDITRGTDPPIFIGSKQQLSAVSFRYQFLNRRDPRNSRYAKEWEKYRMEGQQKYTSIMLNEVFLKLVQCGGAGGACTADSGEDVYINPELQQWLVNANNALTAVSSPELAGLSDMTAVDKIWEILKKEIDKLPTEKLKNDPQVTGAVNSFIQAHLTLDKKRSEMMEKVAKGEVATFEYTNYREVNAPDLSNFRFILSKGFWEGADVTFNGSLTMFNKKPTSTDPTATVKRIRDFDFTLQADIPFSSFIRRAERNAPMTDSSRALHTPLIGIPVLTFSGKYQRLQSDAVMPDGVVKTGTKGDLAFGQAKLTIPINFNGLSIKLPFSITMSNRTDLIKEKEIRGNFGFTLDIDPFFSALKNSLFGNLNQ
ncbi:MAG TPA: hypothetical protein VGO50_20340 [Pyrinomonadaceae bacterium]|jgi:hypothetical protein|nr:hypothetical protein [Pyrinomonadaceae bacterium]